MKNKISIVLVMCMLMLILVASGCASQPSPTPATPSPTTAPIPTTTAPSPTTVKPSPTAAQPIIMKVASYNVASHPTVVVMTNALKMVEEKAPGRFKIDTYLGGSLYTSSKAFEPMTKDIVQIVEDQLSYYESSLGFWAGLSAFPFNWDPMKMWQLWGQPDHPMTIFNETMKKKNVPARVLALTAQPTYAMGRAPIRTPADIKGKLYRVPSDSWGKIVKIWGGEPVFLQHADTLPALQKGTVDGNIVSSLSGAVSGGFDKVVSYVNMMPNSGAGTLAIINTDFLDKLPPDLKSLIETSFDKAMKDYQPTIFAQWDKDIAYFKALPNIKEMYEPTTAEKKQWIDSLKPFFDEIRAKYPAPEDTARYLQLQAKYSP